MGQLQLTQIERRLRKTTFGLIDTSDLGRFADADRERQQKSRALAAFIVARLLGVDPFHAANTITDGPGDNGIDALAVAPGETRLLIVQSKWSENGRGSITLDDMNKIQNGVDDLVNMRWERFNDKVQRRKGET